MYILKTKGTDKISDYIQIRDDDFVLMTHVKVNSMEKTISELIKHDKLDEILQKINKLDYGKFLKIS